MLAGQPQLEYAERTDVGTVFVLVSIGLLVILLGFGNGDPRDEASRSLGERVRTHTWSPLLRDGGNRGSVLTAAGVVLAVIPTGHLRPYGLRRSLNPPLAGHPILAR